MINCGKFAFRIGLDALDMVCNPISVLPTILILISSYQCLILST